MLYLVQLPAVTQHHPSALQEPVSSATANMREDPKPAPKGLTQEKAHTLQNNTGSVTGEEDSLRLHEFRRDSFWGQMGQGAAGIRAGP